MCGAAVGKVLARVFEFVVQGMTALVHVGRGLVEGWRLIEPAAMLVWGSFKRIVAIVGDTLSMLGRATGMTKDGGDAWSLLGRVVGLAGPHHGARE